MPQLAIGYQHVNVPADVFLAQVVGGVGVMKGVRVERPAPNNVTVYHRYTPGWAVIMGILGLLFFLIGALLWFIKRTDVLSVIAEPAGSGCNVTVSGASADAVVVFLSRLVVGGEAEEIYAGVPSPVPA